MYKLILVALMALFYLGCAATPMMEPELKEEPATETQEAPADSKSRSLDEGGIGGTGNNDCNEGKTPESDCQEPRP